MARCGRPPPRVGPRPRKTAAAAATANTMVDPQDRRLLYGDRKQQGHYRHRTTRGGGLARLRAAAHGEVRVIPTNDAAVGGHHVLVQPKVDAAAPYGPAHRPLSRSRGRRADSERCH